MLIATLVIATIGLVRRWLSRRTPAGESGTSLRHRWRASVRRIARAARSWRPGPALAAVVTLAGMALAGMALAPC